MNKFYLRIFLPCLLLLAGCVSMKGYLKGVSPSGEKVYLGSKEITGTEAFQKFNQSPKRETDKQQYLFTRLRLSEGLEFYHDGAWYNKLEAYRGGMWLMRHFYEPGQDTRGFINEHILRSDKGNYHLIRYPDGSVHIGAYVLYNELDLLEETLRK